MAAEKKDEILTSRQIMMVAAEISVKNMKILAKEYLKLPKGLIDQLAAEVENKNDAKEFKRTILRRWANMNFQNQVKVRQSK